MTRCRRTTEPQRISFAKTRFWPYLFGEAAFRIFTYRRLSGLEIKPQIKQKEINLPQISRITQIGAEADLDLTGRVIGCAMRVHRQLGPGFLEKVYENALVMELRHRGVTFSRQVKYNVYYRDERVGTYVADLVIERCLVIELKAVRVMSPVAEAQLLNYLKVSGLHIGLLFNFANKSLETRRIVLNFNKDSMQFQSA